jgi:CubicO group peptidase (beta-lactamase class C family)
MQLGADLVVTVSHPGGRVLARTDMLTNGPEFISLSSDTAGIYQVALSPFDPVAPRGSYFVQILEQRPAAQTLPGKVDQLFAELDETWMPGAIVVVLQDGEIVHTNAFGMADLENDLPLTTTTPINICSIGKQLTAFAIALLADQGQLGLDDDIREHLPWLPDFNYRITIRHLIHHTSGLREMDDLWLFSVRADDPMHYNDFHWFVERQQDLNFPPGEQYLYCNTGYILLGEIIHAVTGLPFIDWMQTNVLVPLGMHNTSFYHKVEALVPGFAWSYHLGSDRNFHRYDMSPAWYVGAGNVFTTAEDLSRWLLHLQDPWICAHRVVAQMAQGGKLANGESTSYAFAQDRQIYRGLPVLEHGGGGWGYQSFIMRFPEQSFATIVVSNFIYGSTFSRARQITDLYLAELLTEAKPDNEYVNRRKAVANDSESLNTFTGTYQQSSGAIAILTGDGNRLSGQIAGLDRVVLFPENPTSFFVKEADLQVVFDVTARERAVGLTVITPADTVTYTRIGEMSIAVTDLTNYEGGFISDELDVEYVVQRQGKQLWVQVPGSTRILLTRVHGDFFRCPYFTLEFERDDQSGVSGFRVSCERSLNIRFHKK